jgi:glycosyltransferase involved in cell wall biosynthesis
MAAKIQVMQLIAPITIGGAEKVVLMLLDHLNRDRFEVQLGCFISGNRPENVFLDRVRQNYGEPEIIWMRKTVDFDNIRQLRDILIRDKIQILHTHGYRSDIIGYLATRKLQVARIATVHGYAPTNTKLRLYEWFDRRKLRYFDRIICVSESIQADLIRHQVSENKLTLVPNAVAATNGSDHQEQAQAKSEICHRWGIVPDSILLGTIARLSPEKGLSSLIQAYSSVIINEPKLKLLIVGDGPERNQLQMLVNRLSLNGNVIFCGFQSAIESYYNAFDLYILSSITEGLPISLLEAMSMSKPVIATAVGGVPNLIIHHQTGLLVPPEDTAGLAESIRWAVSHPLEMLTMGKAARLKVVQNYSITEWKQRIESIYDEAVNEKTNF